MKMMTMKILCSILFVCVMGVVTNVYGSIDIPVHARGGEAWEQQRQGAGTYYKISSSSLTYNQRIDHFNATDLRTFPQHYYVNDTFYTPNSPVFLTLGGEGPMTGVYGGYVLELAEQLNALVLGIEHRFYGQSVPLNDWSTENLHYLTIDQVMADYDAFMGYIKHELSLPTGTKWLVVGGSYSGALSAWLKEVTSFPDLAASWSSSGVVNAILDFPEFDMSVRKAIGQECATAVTKTTLQMEAAIAQGHGHDMKALFNATSLSDTDFFYMTADSAAMACQYGHKDKLCNAMVGVPDDELIHTFANFTNTFWGPAFGSGCFYDTECLKTDESANRVWRWQKCSQLAYLQTAPVQGSLRSTSLTLEVLVNQCHEIFGIDIFPNTEAINYKFGGALPYGMQTWYNDASDDPWKEASVYKPSAYINCTLCGHCIDLHASLPTDPPSLQHARTQMTNQLKKWLAS